MTSPTAYRWIGITIGAVAGVAAIGCESTGPRSEADRALMLPAGIDPAKVSLTLDQIPDDPPAPEAADLSKTPAMPQPAFARYQDAKALFAEKRYADAAHELEEAARYDPDQYEIHRLLCLAYQLSGNDARARARARITLELNPQDVAARYVLGRSAFSSKQTDEALRYFRTALKCPATDRDAVYRALIHVYLGIVLDDLGYARAALGQFDAFDAALAGLDEAQRDHPELAAVLTTRMQILRLRRGRALARLGRFREAADVLAGPAAESPNDLALQTEYARILVLAGQADTATAHAWKVVRNQNASAKSVELLTTVRRWTGREARSVDDLRQLVQEYPDRLDLALGLAQQLADDNRIADATDVLQAAQRAHPDAPEPTWMLVDLLRRQGRWREWIIALADLAGDRPQQYPRIEQAAAAAADNAEPIRRAIADLAPGAEAGETAHAQTLPYVLGVLAVAIGDDALAETQLRLAVRRAPEDVGPVMALGRLLASQYRWAEMIEIADAAADAGGKTHALEWLAGQGHDGLDEWDAAVARYTDALQLNPRDLRSLKSLGLLYERMGETKKAQAVFKDYLEQDPRDAEVRERLFRSLLSTGDIAAGAHLLQLQEQHGQRSPVYRRSRALFNLLRTSDDNAYREELAAIVNDAPKDVRTREEYAGALFSAKKYDACREQVDALLAIDPDSTVGLELKALLYTRALDYGSAADAMEALLRRHPNRESWIRTLTEVYLIELRYDRAIATLRRLIDLPSVGSRRTGYQSQLLDVLDMAGREQEMRETAEQWLAAAPNDLHARRLVLAADEKAGDYARIVQRCRAWLETGGDSNRLWQLHLLNGLQGGKRYVEAYVEILDWLDDAPDDFTPIQWFADLLASAGRYEDAIEWIRAAAAADPDKEAGFLNMLYSAQIQAHEYEGAIQTMRRLSRYRANLPFDPDVRIAQTFIQAGQYEEAEVQLKTLIDRTESDFAKAELLRTLAYCYQKQQRPVPAEQRMREALKLAPLDVGINNDLGYTLADAGRDLADAERMVRFAVGESPREAAYLDSLGWVYYKKGEFADARRWLERAAAQPGDGDPVIYDHLGDAVWRLGDRRAAQSRWTQAVERIDAAEPGKEAPDVELRGSIQAKLEALASDERPAVAPTADEMPPATQPATQAQ
jgi:tetratricopeptide (TPR) repeat protein